MTDYYTCRECHGYILTCGCKSETSPVTQPTTTEPDLTEAMGTLADQICGCADRDQHKRDVAAIKAYTDRVIATALELRAHGERQAIETRFWAMVDRDGLTGLPSDMWAALDRLVKDRAAIAERDARIRELEGALTGFVVSLTSSLRNREAMLTINHDELVKLINSARAILTKQEPKA